MNNTFDRIKKINIENNIWIIYIGIIIVSFIANHYEKDYFLNNNINSKNKYRELNILVFIILICVYSYFENDAIESFFNSNKNEKQYLYDNLTLFATTLVLISGFIFLYVLIDDKNIDSEIAFN